MYSHNGLFWSHQMSFKGWKVREGKSSSPEDKSLKHNFPLSHNSIWHRFLTKGLHIRMMIWKLSHIKIIFFIFWNIFFILLKTKNYQFQKIKKFGKYMILNVPKMVFKCSYVETIKKKHLEHFEKISIFFFNKSLA